MWHLHHHEPPRKPPLVKPRREKKEKRRRKKHRKPRIDYAQRVASLTALGFKSYGDYLASELWAGIRVRVLERDDGRCRLCGRPASQVHHKSYDLATMAGVALDALASLCSGDHRRIEFADGAKAPADSVGANYARARRRQNAALIFSGDMGRELDREFAAIVRDETGDR